MTENDQIKERANRMEVATVSAKFDKEDILKVENEAIFRLADFEYDYYAYGYAGKLFYNSSKHSHGIACHLDRHERASAGVTMDGTVVYTVYIGGDHEDGDRQVVVPFINDIEDLTDDFGDPIPLGAHIAVEDYENYVNKEGCFVFNSFSEIEELGKFFGLDECFVDKYLECETE